jgi:hypothetical protein
MLIVLCDRTSLEQLFAIRDSRHSANDERFVRYVTLISRWKRAKRLFACRE